MSQKRPLMMVAAVLLSTGLATTAPGAAVQAAAATVASPGLGRGTTADGSFHIEWTLSARKRGGETISGYLYNDGPDFAKTVALRITALDSSGHPVGSIVQPVTDVPPGNQVYFQAPAPARSQSYRVSVDWYDVIQGSTE